MRKWLYTLRTFKQANSFSREYGLQISNQKQLQCRSGRSARIKLFLSSEHKLGAWKLQELWLEPNSIEKKMLPFGNKHIIWFWHILFIQKRSSEGLRKLHALKDSMKHLEILNENKTSCARKLQLTQFSQQGKNQKHGSRSMQTSSLSTEYSF